MQIIAAFDTSVVYPRMAIVFPKVTMTQLNRGMTPAEVENFDWDRVSKGRMW